MSDIDQPYMNQKIMVPFHHKLPKDYTFPQRLFDLLKMPEYSHAIYWSRDGMHVVVRDQETLLQAAQDLTNKALQQDSQPLFNWATFQSFRRQMSIWGFMQAHGSSINKAEFGNAQHLYTHTSGVGRHSTRKELLNLLRNAPPKLDRLIKAGKPLPAVKPRKNKSSRNLLPYSRASSEVDSDRSSIRSHFSERNASQVEPFGTHRERPRRAAADECNRKILAVNEDGMEMQGSGYTSEEGDFTFQVKSNNRSNFNSNIHHRSSSDNMSIQSIVPASEDEESSGARRMSGDGPDSNYYSRAETPESRSSPVSTASTLSTSPASISESYYDVQSPPDVPAPYYESDYSGMLDLHMISDYIPISPLSAAFSCENIGLHRSHANTNSFRGWNEVGSHSFGSRPLQPVTNGTRLSSLSDLQINIPSRNFPPTPQSAFFNYGRSQATPTLATASYTLMNELPLADFLADRFEMTPGHSELVSPATAGYWSQTFANAGRRNQHCEDILEAVDEMGHLQQMTK